MGNILSKLMGIIPGYEGYASKEKRRDADEVLRRHLSQQYEAEQKKITRLSQLAMDGGGLQYLTALEEVNRTLNRFISRLQSSVQGYSPMFSEVKIGEADLDRIYEFDARLADSVPILQEQIAFAEKNLGTDSFGEAIGSLQRLVEGLNEQFDERQALVYYGKHV